MKYFLSAAIMMIFSVACFSQSKKVTVYCYLDERGYATYGNTKKLLPDSITTGLLINPREDENIKNGNALLWMNLNDWQLVTAMSSTSGSGFVSTSITYLLKKDIWLSNAAFEIYKNNLKNNVK